MTEQSEFDDLKQKSIELLFDVQLTINNMLAITRGYPHGKLQAILESVQELGTRIEKVNIT